MRLWTEIKSQQGNSDLTYPVWQHFWPGWSSEVAPSECRLCTFAGERWLWVWHSLSSVTMRSQHPCMSTEAAGALVVTGSVHYRVSRGCRALWGWGGGEWWTEAVPTAGLPPAAWIPCHPSSFLAVAAFPSHQNSHCGRFIPSTLLHCMMKGTQSREGSGLCGAQFGFLWQNTPVPVFSLRFC